MVEEARNIQREVFPNGLTVLTERMDHIRSVSMGIWIKSGSRHEDPHVNGISHFVEHMVFKGTSNRSAEQIARQVDSIGGNMDAFTGKETICFNTVNIALGGRSLNAQSEHNDRYEKTKLCNRTPSYKPLVYCSTGLVVSAGPEAL